MISSCDVISSHDVFKNDTMHAVVFDLCKQCTLIAFQKCLHRHYTVSQLLLAKAINCFIKHVICVCVRVCEREILCIYEVCVYGLYIIS